MIFNFVGVSEEASRKRAKVISTTTSETGRSHYQLFSNIMNKERGSSTTQSVRMPLYLYVCHDVFK